MAKLAPCLILLLLAASPSALADSWGGFGHNARGFDRGFYRGFDNRHGGWRGGFNSGYRWTRGRSFGNSYRDNFISVSYGSLGSHRSFGAFRSFDRWPGRYRNSRYYSRGFHRGYSRGYSRGLGWGYRNNDAANLLGGVVLGSLLTQTFSQPRTEYVTAPVVNRTVVRSSPARIVSRPTPASVSTVQHRTYQHRTYLLRDLQGDCFEVERDAQGTEIRTQLAQERCQY